MTENQTLIHLIDQAQLVSQLQQQLHQAQQQIQQLQSQLASTTPHNSEAVETTETTETLDITATPSDTPQTIEPTSTTVTTDEPLPSPPQNETSPMDAVMLLVNSMSQLTHKMDLLLDRTVYTTDTKTAAVTPRPKERKPIGSIRAEKEKQNIGRCSKTGYFG